MDLEKLISSSEYNFIREDEHLKNHMLFITLGGSHAYGTNNENSDIDIRGCALNSVNDILGLSNFEQKIDTTTDTVIYSFNKLIPLLENCNPNVIEMLGCRADDYIFYDSIGKELINNRKLFLSKKCVNSFCGYANAKLNRLMNALARDSEDSKKLIDNMLRSMESMMFSFNDKYRHFDNGSIRLYADKNYDAEDDLENIIYADISLSKYPLKEYNSIMNELSNVAKCYNKCGKRNHKKDDEHLNKHAMHLIRLYLMGIDILEKEEIITYREKDRDLLMDIRNGKYQKEDHSYSEEFFELLESLKERMTYASNNSALPDKPNKKEIEEFVIEVNKHSIEV